MSTRKRIYLILAKEQLKMARWYNSKGLTTLYESALQRAKDRLKEAKKLS